MAFKADGSFLRYLSIGAVGVQRVIKHLHDAGFEPIELERYCTSNKIWATKVKRLRLPDLLCIRTGMRVEVRAKTDLKIRMSDAPSNPERVWDAGLRGNDVVALIACFDSDEGPRPANHCNYFTVRALRESIGMSKLGPPKSASEGAERDRTWPSTVPKRDGKVLTATSDKITVQMHAATDRASRKQTYRLDGKSTYARSGSGFEEQSTIIAGAPTEVADLTTYLDQTYEPLHHLDAESSVDRYAAVKALRFRNALDGRSVQKLEDLIEREEDDRVALEAAGTAAALGSELGQEVLLNYIWKNEDLAELRMEAVFILTELGSSLARDQLKCVVSDPRFEGDELRQAAVWGLGKAGFESYEELLPFIDDEDEHVAIHAIASFASDCPAPVLELLVRDLVVENDRRAAAASLTLRTIASDGALKALLNLATTVEPVPNWIIATLGMMPEAKVREHVTCPEIMERIAPMQLLSGGANWLGSETTTSDIAFLQKQNVW